MYIDMQLKVCVHISTLRNIMMKYSTYILPNNINYSMSREPTYACVLNLYAIFNEH